MITLALVLTPVASAKALAALCALEGLDVDVIPSARGAIVVRAVGAVPQAPPAGDVESGDVEGGELLVSDVDWNISELIGDDVPAEARELAAKVSRLTRVGVVLVTARLTEDGAFEAGLSGQVVAQSYAAGEAGEDLPAGLVLAGADDVVEDLLLGRRAVTEVPGHVRSRDADRGRRRFGKGLRRPRP